LVTMHDFLLANVLYIGKQIEYQQITTKLKAVI